MVPDRFRKGRGFAGLFASVPALLAASPVLAQQQGFSANTLAGAIPLTVALGAGGFALLGFVVLRENYIAILFAILAVSNYFAIQQAGGTRPW